MMHHSSLLIIFVEEMRDGDGLVHTEFIINKQLKKMNWHDFNTQHPGPS
jgi:hypothetical protein